MLHLADAAPISERRATQDGYMIASARAARTGIQVYGGFEVGKPEMATVRVYRPEGEVFSHDSRSSYAHKPITNNHPAEPVSSRNWKQHAVGHVGGEIARDGEFIVIPLLMADAEAITALDAGRRELSVGYSCELDWTPGTTSSGETYDARQTKIRVNHVALVDKGRAGAECRIRDTANETQNTKDAVMESNTWVADTGNIATIPGNVHSLMVRAKAGLSTSDPMALEQAIRNARNATSSFARDRASSNGLITDAQSSAIGHCINVLNGYIADAQKRLSGMR